MKCLCITANFLPEIGGMQLSTHQTLTALSEAEVEITLLADKCKNDVVFDQLADYKIIRVGLSGYLGAIKKLW
ncbi:MAG: hypothetical protein K0U12_00370, partial [Gammaproteobacteria bacterium]|nr:hypothetical protein [Gammaproteobacteria bacterium]